MHSGGEAEACIVTMVETLAVLSCNDVCLRYLP